MQKYCVLLWYEYFVVVLWLTMLLIILTMTWAKPWWMSNKEKEQKKKKRKRKKKNWNISSNEKWRALLLYSLGREEQRLIVQPPRCWCWGSELIVFPYKVRKQCGLWEPHLWGSDTAGRGPSQADADTQHSVHRYTRLLQHPLRSFFVVMSSGKISLLYRIVFHDIFVLTMILYYCIFLFII